jgi:hypothetical protein
MFFNQHECNDYYLFSVNLLIMKSFLLIIAIFVFTAGCKKYIPSALKATLVDTSNIDCGYPLLNFADDSNRIRSITKQTGLYYVAKGLPDSFRIAGKRLLVDVSLLSSDNDFACTTLGISYPHILIVKAIPR